MLYILRKSNIECVFFYKIENMLSNLPDIVIKNICKYLDEKNIIALVKAIPEIRSKCVILNTDNYKRLALKKQLRTLTISKHFQNVNLYVPITVTELNLRIVICNTANILYSKSIIEKHDNITSLKIICRYPNPRYYSLKYLLCANPICYSLETFMMNFKNITRLEINAPMSINANYFIYFTYLERLTLRINELSGYLCGKNLTDISLHAESIKISIKSKYLTNICIVVFAHSSSDKSEIIFDNEILYIINKLILYSVGVYLKNNITVRNASLKIDTCNKILKTLWTYELYKNIDISLLQVLKVDRLDSNFNFSECKNLRVLSIFCTANIRLNNINIVFLYANNINVYLDKIRFVFLHGDIKIVNISHVTNLRVTNNRIIKNISHVKNLKILELGERTNISIYDLPDLHTLCIEETCTGDFKHVTLPKLKGITNTSVMHYLCSIVRSDTADRKIKL